MVSGRGGLHCARRRRPLAPLGERETAAVFVGAVTNGPLARLRALPPHELADYHEFILAIRSQLGDDHHQAAVARSATMTYEQIAGFALAAVHDLPQR